MPEVVILIAVIGATVVLITFIRSLFKTIRLIYLKNEGSSTCPHCRGEAAPPPPPPVDPGVYAERLKRLQKRIDTLEEILLNSR